MRSNREELSKAEKLNVLRQDQSLREQRKREFNTFHGRAIADAGPELGGRFKAAMPQPNVVGSTPIAYPKMPANNPWAQGIDQLTGIEPPLGYCIDEMEQDCIPTAEASSVGDAKSAELSSVRTSLDDGNKAAREPTSLSHPGSGVGSLTVRRRV